VCLRDLVRALPDVVFGAFYVEEEVLCLDVFEADCKRSHAWPVSEARKGAQGEPVTPFVTDSGDLAVLECVMQLMRPTVVHVNHLIHHSRAIYGVASAYRLPIVHTLHDFYSICPGIHIRAWPPTDADMAASAGAGMPSVADWQKGMQELLGAADMLTAPSGFVFDAVEQFLPLDRGRCRVIPHGLPEALLEQRVKRTRRADGATHLRVGVLGTLKLNSAWLEHLKRAPEEMELHYFGHVPLIYEPDAGHRTTMHGIYERDSIVGRLAEADLDLVVLPSPMVETFSLALSEAWAAGLPVLAPDQGALAERLAGGGGWLYPANTVGAAGEKLRELASDPRGIESEMAKVAALELKPMAEQAAIYREVWDKAIERHAVEPGNRTPGQRTEL
jgi:glycosyltransferase involved in cell wall biosynthesis